MGYNGPPPPKPAATDDLLRSYYTDEEWEIIRTAPRPPTAHELRLLAEAQEEARQERIFAVKFFGGWALLFAACWVFSWLK